MKLFLSEQCLSLTGCLGRGYGYFIQARRTKSGKVSYFSQRSKYGAPPDGHWRFIVTCAELAQNRLHITDIRVSRDELKTALYEARCFIAMQNLRLDTYSARDILNLKTTFSL